MGNFGNSRAPWHDYRSPAKYLITFMKAKEAPSFGDIRGFNDNPYLLLSKTGTIAKDTLRELRLICENIKIWQYIVMPDHIHFLLNVEFELDEPLGNYLARLKAATNNHAGFQIYQKGFNDQIITPARDLDTIFQYIRNNPRRLAARLANPDFFRRANQIEIAGTLCNAYGNLNLLENPFREQVVCHRADTQEIRTSNLQRYLYTASNGGILVSPFISPAEKEIRRAAEELGSKIILISNHQFGEREKPPAHDFSLCEQGRLLILSPCELPTGDILSRATCLAMNAFAEKLSGAPIFAR